MGGRLASNPKGRSSVEVPPGFSVRRAPMRLIAAVAASFLTVPAMAEVTVTFPISIPQECVELAQRHGVPIIITSRYQAAKAKIKLGRLKDSDPMVHECREAVERARGAAGGDNASAHGVTTPPSAPKPRETND